MKTGDKTRMHGINGRLWQDGLLQVLPATEKADHDLCNLIEQSLRILKQTAGPLAHLGLD